MYNRETNQSHLSILNSLMFGHINLQTLQNHYVKGIFFFPTLPNKIGDLKPIPYHKVSLWKEMGPELLDDIWMAHLHNDVTWPVIHRGKQRKLVQFKCVEQLPEKMCTSPACKGREICEDEFLRNWTFELVNVSVPNESQSQTDSWPISKYPLHQELAYCTCRDKAHLLLQSCFLCQSAILLMTAVKRKGWWLTPRCPYPTIPIFWGQVVVAMSWVWPAVSQKRSPPAKKRKNIHFEPH